jgi:hypothetical protein
VLGEREPVPRRVVGDVAPPGVAPEAAQERSFERGRVAAEPLKARLEPFVRQRPAPVRVVGAVPAELLPPRVPEENLVQLGPAGDADVLHARRVPGRRGR